MAIRAEQKMADFVCDGATQNCGDLFVTLRETRRIFVVDTGESRKKGDTEKGVLEPMRDAPGEYPKHYVGRFASLAAQPLWVGGGVPVKAV
jgi:hypothetical protein